VAKVVGAELELEALPGAQERGHHHAGVVDQQIEPLERLDRGRPGGLLGDDLLQRRLALVRVSAREHDICAASGEHARRLETDADVGSGDKGRAAGLVGDVVEGPGVHEQTPYD
jgi:hypothetical protein